ncbi:hypothetical protein DAPPUDRAFT_248559 [Daphnia pulex]|uniref:Uncharacterized protein n=1 Tax=Daphnia pulex TaxID=6669 RepID=E9GUD8_DAPPU|nr:hypothetical protein DAPPUDRAFT_248559 [Daphnia pulex]|eukprot:EFX76814.1 hypothetical protein DAPPUDRAFT_248559 [Daphnia pulex]
MPMEELAAASSVSSFTCLDTLYCYAVLRKADLSLRFEQRTMRMAAWVDDH